ncbi:MAG: MarR family transcriptional regulator [Verrucomicrobia bacterium]|jgi:DNA-binding MarR family transcriptional regulator|nr:MarR family transcriptional regulator [Verrucomicrobiota bacterium]
MSTALRDELGNLFEEAEIFVGAVRNGSRIVRGARPLSAAGQAVLRLLSREPGLTVPQVARQRGRSRQNVQVLADRLAEAGWVQYVPNCDHCRSERLELTAAGAAVLAAANRAHGVRHAEIGPCVSIEELQTCIQTLRTIRGKLWPAVQPRPTVLQNPQTRTWGRRAVAAARPPASSPARLPEVEFDASPPDALPVNLL